MGAVYKVEHVVLRRTSALKLLPQERTDKADRSVRRFLREARSAATLSHANIVTVFDAGEAEGRHFIDMEFVDGESVQDRLQREGRLSVQEASRVVCDTARALSAAHAQGIVHRDVKPANILLDKDGKVRVADFGLAKSVEGDESLITIEGKGGIGTPAFMSPEQCDGLLLDGRTDIYSLGVTYFNLLTGDLPFRGDSALAVMRQHRTAAIPDPRKAVGSLSEPTCQAITKAMAKKPEHRYQSCDEMVADLSAILEHPKAEARGPRKRRRAIQSLGSHMTPMPDIVFLLTRLFLTMFVLAVLPMVAAMLAKELQGSPPGTDRSVSLPQADAARYAVREPGTVVVNLRPNGCVKIGDKLYIIRELPRVFRQFAETNALLPVLVRADARTAHEHFLRTLESCARAGLLNVSVAARRVKRQEK